MTEDEYCRSHITESIREAFCKHKSPSRYQIGIQNKDIDSLSLRLQNLTHSPTPNCKFVKINLKGSYKKSVPKILEGLISSLEEKTKIVIKLSMFNDFTSEIIRKTAKANLVSLSLLLDVEYVIRSPLTLSSELIDAINNAPNLRDVTLISKCTDDYTTCFPNFRVVVIKNEKITHPSSDLGYHIHMKLFKLSACFNEELVPMLEHLEFKY